MTEQTTTLRTAEEFLDRLLAMKPTDPKFPGLLAMTEVVAQVELARIQRGRLAMDYLEGLEVTGWATIEFADEAKQERERTGALRIVRDTLGLSTEGGIR